MVWQTKRLAANVNASIEQSMAVQHKKFLLNQKLSDRKELNPKPSGKYWYKDAT